MAVSPEWQPRLQQKLEPLTRQLDRQELIWASGFLAGLANRVEAVAEVAQATRSVTRQSADVLHIWYGSQTGNGRGVAEQLAEAARNAGIQVELEDLARIAPRSIRSVKRLSLVVSTHGEGDPPDDAEALHEYLHGEQAPRLDGLHYCIFALGDSSYRNFCQTGKEFDAVLARLGGKAVVERIDADVDYEAVAGDWRVGVVNALTATQASPTVPVTQLSVVASAGPMIDKHHPWQAGLLSSQPLTVAPSAKTVHHIELSLEGSGLQYEPGDSLGVWPHNPPQLVAEFLERFNRSADEVITIHDEQYTVGEWLSRRLELTQLTRPFLVHYAEATAADELHRLLDNAERLQTWMEQHQVIDVLDRFPAQLPTEHLFAMLRRLSPRSYSIASSPLATPHEVHLVVRTVGGWQQDRLRAGSASWYLNSQLRTGRAVDVFVEPNRRFRLPEDRTASIIMIGPGTGVAPFRSFVEHRKAQGAAGRNWLFFGEQYRRTDFLYQLEWQRHLKDGVLTRLSVAFSRDQQHKLYVQDRLREQGRAVYDWLESGAYVYVCGDARRMAPDVEQALLDVIEVHGNTDSAGAAAYLKVMKNQGRYRRDVY